MSTSARTEQDRINAMNSESDNSSATRKRLETGLPPVNYTKSSGKHVQLPTQSAASLSNTHSLLAGLMIGGLAAGAYALYRTTLSQRDSLLGNSIAGWLPNGDPITIRKRRTVKVKPSILYAEGRKLENLPTILSHLKSIEVLDGKRSYWKANGPAGLEVSWIAKITEDEPGRAIELGRRVAKAFGENPMQQIEDDLTRFKHAMEVREHVHA